MTELEMALAVETLTGDVRDALLTHVRSMETPWSKLSERDQEDKIAAMESAAHHLVSRAVQVIAHKGFPHVLASVGKYTVDKGVKVETLIAASLDNITKLAEHGKGAAILVLADAAAFFGEQTEAKADADEPELPIEAEAA